MESEVNDMMQEKKGYLTITFIIVIAFIASFYALDFVTDSIQQAIEAKLNEILEGVNLDISLDTEK